ncbi:MAG TPA: cysteine desulfurase [Steroidobacteraceae bacterium]|nr:cysteine desulfurase [Steroidobacteraceae bacterium]
MNSARSRHGLHLLTPQEVQADFPILSRTINGRRLAYLDSGASTQRPQSVIDAVDHYETQLHANVHRGVHTLSQLATDAYEGARDRVRRFINAASTREIVFVRGTTEAINLVANSWGRGGLGSGGPAPGHLGPDDEIIVSALEHHANLVPWQMAAAATGAKLRVIPIDDHGQIRFEAFQALLNDRTRLVAITHVSNALGTIVPVQRVIAAAHHVGVPVLVDGAQAVAHTQVDVQALDCDFYCFSGHKLYAPTGIGVLYGREKLLEAMPPWQGGGDMIRTVSYERSTWNDLPHKFEAGTPNISGAIGLAAAMDYLEGLGIGHVAAHEHQLLAEATAALMRIPGIHIHGTAPDKAGILSFTLKGVHPHDLGTVLDHEGVAIRAGHHCAMPLMDLLGLPATARASFGCYNSMLDVEQLEAAVRKAVEVFR